MRKKKIVSVLLAGCMVLSQSSLLTYAYTDSEIEKRINEVGQSYFDSLDEASHEFSMEYDYDDSSSSSGGLLDWLFGSSDSYSKTASATVDDMAGAPEESSRADSKNSFDVSVEEEAFSGESLMAGASESDYRDNFQDDFVELNTAEFSNINEAGFVSVKTQPFSTFGADVDTASYATLRKSLLMPLYEQKLYDYDTRMPWDTIPTSAIRVEEMMNYFHYDYAEPEDGEKFGVTTNLTSCPWNDDTLLLKVGVKAEDNHFAKGSNIVFLVDTSGSMDCYDSLPLVKKALSILAKQLTAEDRVSIVTYAGSSKVVLQGASGEDYEEIIDALHRLSAGGSTNGADGINTAYELAEKYFIEGGNNRVILCTDGDFNVGVSSEGSLKDLISEKRESNIFLSCLGFGGVSINYSDTTMEALADNGNGNYFYIDSVREAQRALNEEFESTIYTVAKDTKFQVEFNPEAVSGYRLVGYDNRLMSAEDFNDDTKDGGEVGAGSTVTILYEVVPVDSDMDIPVVESRYDKKSVDAETESTDLDEYADELAFVKLRYKEPEADKSVLREYPIANVIEDMDEDTSWAAGVAQFGMLMRDSEYAGSSTFKDIFSRLKDDSDIMDDDYKAEFLYMLRIAKDYKDAETAMNKHDYDDYDDYYDVDDDDYYYDYDFDDDSDDYDWFDD